MLSYLNYSLSSLNQSKLFMGIIMLLMNIGSKYVEFGFSKTQEQALRNGIGREILIFAIIFLGTHDIVISILMTAAFIILSDHVFNEESDYCMVPNYLKNIASIIDTNKDGKISPEEEKRAMDLLRKADLQRDEQQQRNVHNFFKENI
tara:strand:+ start:269 stop:712 length:444 start_codon:yes stop_codon:yes gene_type:complete